MQKRSNSSKQNREKIRDRSFIKDQKNPPVKNEGYEMNTNNEQENNDIPREGSIYYW